tara:strand:+ start:172 stop:453 length:282 start_codon:yes stop_codon:yes gene_type:complete
MEVIGWISIVVLVMLGVVALFFRDKFSSNVSSIVVGIVVSVLGVFLVFSGEISSIIIGVALVLLGFYIISNESEDEIEQIKNIPNKIKGGKKK